MALFTRSNELSALRPGIHDWWGLGYAQIPEQYSKLFEVLKSNMAYERDVNMYGLSTAQVTPEGTAVQFDAMGEGYKYDYVHLDYTKGAEITHQALRDNLYMQMGEENMKEIGRAMHETKEIVHANIFNQATNNAVVYADGQPLLSQNHALAGGGTYSNMTAVDMDISEYALEQAVSQIMQYRDDRGKRILVNPEQVIVHPDNMFEIARILKSELRVGTADNDINAIKDGRYFPKGYFVYRFLTDPDMWFVKTDMPKGLRSFVREAIKSDADHVFETDTIRLKSREAYSCGVTNTMCIFGSPGA